MANIPVHNAELGLPRDRRLKAGILQTFHRFLFQQLMFKKAKIASKLLATLRL
jgi:hypothetical protein